MLLIHQGKEQGSFGSIPEALDHAKKHAKKKLRKIAFTDWQMNKEKNVIYWTFYSHHNEVTLWWLKIN